MCPSVVVYRRLWLKQRAYAAYLRANSMRQCCRSHCCSKSLKQYPYNFEYGVKYMWWICAWNNYVSYTLVCVHFIVCSIYVCSSSTPSFSSPANSAIPNRPHWNRAAQRSSQLQMTDVASATINQHTTTQHRDQCTVNESVLVISRITADDAAQAHNASCMATTNTGS